MCNVNKMLKKKFIFTSVSDREELRKFNDELYFLSKNFADYMNDVELMGAYDKIFSSLNDTNRELYNFYVNNFDEIEGYFELLKSKVQTYYVNKKNSNNKQFINNMIYFSPVMKYVSDYDMDDFIENSLSLKTLEDYYYECSKKAKLYGLLNVYISEDEEPKLLDFVKNTSFDDIYCVVRDMFEYTGCGDIEIDSSLIDGMIYYLEVMKKMNSVHSVGEEEMISTIFNPVKEKVKKIGTID